MFCTYVSNLVILAWTADELSCGQASDWYTHTHTDRYTDRGDDNTRRPKLASGKNWPWKSKAKVMGDVKVESHNVSLTSYRLTSLLFHVNLASHCWLRFFQNLTLKFKARGHRWGHSSKSQCGYNILSTNIPFVPCQSALPFLRYSIFKISPWSRVKVMGEVTV